jgi:hypothetical protein
LSECSGKFLHQAIRRNDGVGNCSLLQMELFPPQNLHVESLTSNVTGFRGKVLKEVIKAK